MKLRTWGCNLTKCYCRWDWLWVGSGLGKACTVNKLYRGLGVSTGVSVPGNVGDDYGKRDKSKLQDLGLERKTDIANCHAV